MACWLLKTEPDSYAWRDLVREQVTEWTGVRNHAAARHLRAMSVGDRVLIYQSGSQKAVMGIAIVARAAQTDGAPPWVSVAVQAGEPLPNPVPLSAMKAEAALTGMAMLRQSRLSVSAVRGEEWDAILALAECAPSPAGQIA